MPSKALNETQSSNSTQTYQLQLGLRNINANGMLVCESYMRLKLGHNTLMKMPAILNMFITLAFVSLAD